ATPSDGVAGLDNAFANTFNFTWSGIPADTTEIRIQVCRDSACTNPLATMTNGVQLCSSAVTCAATTSYTLNGACAGQSCIKPVNGADYYARLRVTDSIGTISSFGTISSGKKIVGGITGVIRDTFNNPVNGATVNLYQSDCSTLVGPGGAITTTASGVFTFTNAAYAVPILTASSGYCVKASSGAAQGQKTQINVDAGVNTDIGSLYIVNTTGRGCIIGSLVEGSSGSQMLLSNATFTLKDFTGATISGAPNLDPDGKQFAFPASCVTSWGAAPYTSPTYYYSGDSNCSLATGNCLNSGIYSLDVSVPNYYSITESAIGVTSNATIHTGYLPMVGTFASGSKQIKVIATWGTGVKDLDLHVVGPSSNAFDCQPYNEAAIQNANGALSKFHVYFQQKYCAETGTFAPVGSTQLAVDDTYEYGPEIINFYQGFVDGTYKFSIFNNDTVIANWNTSKARVYIYAGNYFTGGGGLIKTITNTASSANSTWKPFKLVVSGTTLTIDDNAGSTYGFVSLTSAQVNGVSDGLTAGGAVSGVSPADPNTDPGLYLNGTTAAGGAGPLDW
ncbi:MAG: hypothetical protein J0L53_11505, partial [Spirochaetes bacterium]|nr:hypothetical protein [Spirochaetota bacterium]